jgi:acyl carrier protein
MTPQTTATQTSILSKSDIIIKLRDLLQELLKLEDPNSISVETRLREDLNIDSLGMVDMVILVEEAFNVQFRSANFSKVNTLGDVADLILDRLQSPHARRA